MLQNLVDKIFGDYPVTDDHEPFIPFGDSSTKELSIIQQQLSAAGQKSSFIRSRSDKKALRAAINLALDLITKRKLNPSLVKLALGIYLTHSKEAHTVGVVVPSLIHHHEFKSTQTEVKDAMGKVRIPLSNPVTADTMQGVEILSYFREDSDFNDHHYRWHMVYPATGIVESDNKTHRRVIDRQGELFLYMHSQMIARYNAELLSWGLNMVHSWGYDDVLTFGYTPVPALRHAYGARPPFRGWFENRSPKNPMGPEHFPSKKEMIRWRNNVFKAIEDGFFYTQKNNNEAGKFVLTEENAMNWVGIVIEAEIPELQEVSPGSDEYIDRNLYGNLHNLGHNKFAEIGYHEYMSDKNNYGVMLDNNGSPRDPCFWLWHRHIDDFRQDIVKKYVHCLNQFKPDVKITELKIIPQDAKSKTPPGGLATFLGPPLLEHKEANAKISHEPYKWELTVESFRPIPPDESDPQIFTVRLFIAPKALIQDQRSWIEMDKFTHTLTKLSDTMTRLDTVSSVARKTPKEGEKLSNRCLCGWPQNMMLPVGTPSGMLYVGFAMLTDDKLGKVCEASQSQLSIAIQFFIITFEF